VLSSRGDNHYLAARDDYDSPIQWVQTKGGRSSHPGYYAFRVYTAKTGAPEGSAYTFGWAYMTWDFQVIF